MNDANESLLEFGQLRGDFHMHTTYSDGDDDLESMIASAAARGYEYHAISDHSQGRGRVGMSPERLREQQATIRALGNRYNIRTLCASEVDILPDGSLDYSEDVLAGLDLTVCSVHSALDQTPEEMTRRLIRACENPYAAIIGHPSGRRIGLFGGYEFDFEAVFAAAARTGTAIEIDGQAERLDLPPTLARVAKRAGVTFACDSDAHRAADLPDADFAVSLARRAGITAHEVLNARPLDEVLSFIRRKRSGGYSD